MGLLVIHKPTLLSTQVKLEAHQDPLVNHHKKIAQLWKFIYMGHKKPPLKVLFVAFVLNVAK